MVDVVGCLIQLVSLVISLSVSVSLVVCDGLSRRADGSGGGGGGRVRVYKTDFVGNCAFVHYYGNIYYLTIIQNPPWGR